MTSTRTTCPYCGVGCGVIAERAASGEVTVRGDVDHPANRGRLCSKGSALHETLGPEDRLLHPMIHGQRTTWDSALDRVAGEFTRIIRAHGPAAVALYVSGQLLTEDYYVANKLVKGYLGTANIDTNSRLCMASAVAGHKRAFGEDLVPCSYEDLELADLIVLVGSNTAWCHPVVYQRIEAAKRARPALQIVVVDPRATLTCEIADLHLPIRSGADVALFNGLLVWLATHGCIDQSFVERSTRDLDAALAIATETAGDLDLVAEHCGLSRTALEQFYALFAATSRTITLFSQGVNQSTAGTDKVNSIINCHLLTGRIGKPGAGPFSITGQPNAMGGREVGGMANMLAAHMELENPQHRAIVQSFWRSPRIAREAGPKAVAMFDAVHAGKIKALWIIGTNPVVSLPDAARVREALSRCEFLVVSDCIERTDTNAYAHVLLPAAGWGEKSGTVTNSSRHISRQRAFLPTPGDAQPDWWIVCQVAQRLGFAQGFNYASEHEIFIEHAALSAAQNDGARVFDIGALAQLDSAQYAAMAPVQWPASTQRPDDARRLFRDGVFAHDDQRARFIPVRPRAPNGAVSAAYPFVLNTGRIRDQWHTMTRTGKSPRLAEHLPEPFVEMHPDAAQEIGRAGELVRVVSERGQMLCRLRLAATATRDTVFAPIHWHETNAVAGGVAALIAPHVDPLSGEPELKHTPVRVEHAGMQWYGFVMTRTTVQLSSAVDRWVRIQARHCVRYEVALTCAPADWSSWARQTLGIDSAADVIEYVDRVAGVYRLAVLHEDRLDACLFIARGPSLPSRAWLTAVFEAKAIDARTRRALLSARAPGGAEDTGPIVCSCWGVGRNVICNAIQVRRVRTVAEIGKATRAGTNCGSCAPELRRLLEERLRQ